jgi:chromosome segregation ATPase
MATLRLKQSDVRYNLARFESQRKIAQNEAAKSRQLSAQVATFSQTETELRSQLNIYVEKFKQVEDTLNNSNDLFLTFRKEMEEMSKKTKRFERENLNVTRKLDLCNRNILEMAEERTRVTKEMELLRKQKGTLESVIRKMQDQGRGLPPGNELETGTELEADGDVTESDFDEYDEEGSEEEYSHDDEDTEEEHITLQPAPNGLATLGPVPPPPPPVPQAAANGVCNGGVHSGAG